MYLYLSVTSARHTRVHSRIHSPHGFTQSLIHSPIHSFTNSFMHSCVHSLVCSRIHSLIHPFIHSVSHLLIYSFIRLFIHSVIHPFMIHSFIHSIIRSFIHSVIHPFMIHSFIHSIIRSFIHSRLITSRLITVSIRSLLVSFMLFSSKTQGRGILLSTQLPSKVARGSPTVQPLLRHSRFHGSRLVDREQLFDGGDGQGCFTLESCHQGSHALLVI